ncbi:invasin, partial [Shigella sonnei]|nr:invasin [Shigella sonnei]
HGYEAPASINTHLNSYNFEQSSVEGTFPTTGFTGATFTIVLKDNKKATEYNWTADANWVTATNGIVQFTGTGTSDKVTITGVPTSGQGNIIKYSFRLKSWFINFGKELATYSYAETLCSSQVGYGVPLTAHLTNGTKVVGKDDQSRAANAGLWSEWGDVGNYSAGFRYWTWTSEPAGKDSNFIVILQNGDVLNAQKLTQREVVCRKGL